jgi:8-amino-7-oxononanoate synthase
VLDFASALYLGFQHASHDLRPWAQFSTGVPAALGGPALAAEISKALAILQGCERATLAPSTLHLFWDLFGVLRESRPAIFVDAATYPISRWGVERVAARGVAVRTFGHHDPNSLDAALQAGFSGRPIIVTDGFCPSCGRLAPVTDYLRTARGVGGWLVIDDTQALGIFGHSPGPEAPYGKGGGGTLKRTNITGPQVILASSMAKAFGVPLAVLAASEEIVERFEDQSETRMHCSPPSVATLRAAEHALRLNCDRGDTLRLRLAGLTRHFQAGLNQVGLTHTGGIFPVQSVAVPANRDPAAVHGGLLRSGVRTVLHQSDKDSGPRVSFLITACHTFSQINRAVDLLVRMLRPMKQERAAAR